MNLEFRYRFEAAHRFMQSNSIPCMTPHGHTWYATLNLQFRKPQLDPSQMTVEFSQIKKDWRQLIQGTFDHSYLHNINDPIVEVLKGETHKPRLIPFPGDPTTELISLLVFHKMETLMQTSDFSERLEITSVKIEETPTNAILCSRDFYLQQAETLKKSNSWWNDKDIQSRKFEAHE